MSEMKHSLMTTCKRMLNSLLSWGKRGTSPEMDENDPANPRSPNYIGAIRAIKLGLARCICKQGERDILCPFHGGYG